MAIEKPYSGASNVRLTSILNEDNQIELVFGRDLTFGKPLLYEGDPERNTRVLVSPTRAPGSIRFREKEVHYTRLELDVLDQLPEGFVKSVFIEALPFRIHDILDVINDALGLNLVPDEVEDTEYSEALPSYPLVIKEEESLAWLSSGYQFRARHTGEDILLSDAIQNNVLTGLIWPVSL